MNSGGAGEELAGGVPVGVSVVVVGITGRDEVDEVGSGALVGSLVDEVRVIPSFSAQVSGSMPYILLVLLSSVKEQIGDTHIRTAATLLQTEVAAGTGPYVALSVPRTNLGMRVHTSSIGTASISTSRVVADVASSTHRPVRWTARGGGRNERLVLALAEDTVNWHGVVGDNSLGSQKRAEGNDGGVHFRTSDQKKY